MLSKIIALKAFHVTKAKHAWSGCVNKEALVIAMLIGNWKILAKVELRYQ